MSPDSIHPDILGALSVLAQQPLGITARFLSPLKFLLEIPFCLDQTLQWQLNYSRVGAHHVPDLFFGDAPDFVPLVHSQAVIGCLEKWDGEDRRMLAALMQAVLVSFSAYQRQRLEERATANSALRFEVDTLLGHDDDKAVQVMVTASQAIFVVPAADGLDLGPLRAMLAARGKAAVHLESLQRECSLRVAYPLSAASSMVPAVRLHLPPLLEGLIGKVELPHWPQSGMCTVEYLPQMKERLQRACNAASGIDA